MPQWKATAMSSAHSCPPRSISQLAWASAASLKRTPQLKLELKFQFPSKMQVSDLLVTIHSMKLAGFES